jgi:hypothetical protein
MLRQAIDNDSLLELQQLFATESTLKDGGAFCGVLAPFDFSY